MNTSNPKSWANFQEFKTAGENYLDTVSETVPNQSMTIKEIMLKSINGQPPLVAKNVFYDGEDDFDAVNPTLAPDFDLSDYTIMNEENKIRQEQRKNKNVFSKSEQQPVSEQAPTNEEDERSEDDK